MYKRYSLTGNANCVTALPGGGKKRRQVVGRCAYRTGLSLARERFLAQRVHANNNQMNVLWRDILP